jgi:hypothetical protein
MPCIDRLACTCNRGTKAQSLGAWDNAIGLVPRELDDHFYCSFWVFKRGGVSYIRLSDAQISSPTSSLYADHLPLTHCTTCPKLPSLTLLNFMITQDGLSRTSCWVSSLLKRPDLEEQRQKLWSYRARTTSTAGSEIETKIPAGPERARATFWRTRRRFRS